MQDLRLVAANQQGTHLVLRSTGGEQFQLAVDERLRAAVRGDKARLGQLEIELESQLRPRDIQARIRAGQTAEEVAAAAGIPLERVRRFEGPVLGERQYVAETAQRGAVRLARHGDGAPPPLGETVTARLKPHGVTAEALAWDSWRRDDGKWIVQVTYELEGSREQGRFVFDPRARAAVPDDDEARWLVGDLEHRPGQPPFVPRLASADDPPSGAVGDAPDGDSPERPRPRRISPVDLLVPPRTEPVSPNHPVYSGRREQARAYARPDVEPDVRTAPHPTARPGATPEPAAQPARREPRQPIPDVRPQVARETDLPAATAGADDPGARAPRATPREELMTGTTDRAAERDGVRPGRRATVPSWDEILFGSRRHGD